MTQGALWPLHVPVLIEDVYYDTVITMDISCSSAVTKIRWLLKILLRTFHDPVLTEDECFETVVLYWRWTCTMTPPPPYPNTGHNYVDTYSHNPVPKMNVHDDPVNHYSHVGAYHTTQYWRHTHEQWRNSHATPHNLMLTIEVDLYLVGPHRSDSGRGVWRWPVSVCPRHVHWPRTALWPGLGLPWWGGRERLS